MNLLVGVLGHVDHGKTALVRALTGAQTDRLEEERRRGLSIVLGFAVLRTPAGDVDLVDMPGHERFVRAMIAGATGMRAALVAVDAGEGVRPQTREHLAIAGLIGVRRAAIALTRVDRVTPEVAAVRTAQAEAAVREAGLEAGPAIATSAFTGDGIPALAACLASLAADAPPARDDGVPYLAIDRAFALPGAGPVVTGTLRRGALAVGDGVVLAPSGTAARVRALQIHGRGVTRAEPGRRVAVALRGVAIGDLARGMALVPPHALAPAEWLDVRLTLLPDAPRPLADGARATLLHGTAETPVRLRLLDRPALAPGESAPAQLRCPQGAATLAREPFVLRAGSPAATLGGGRVLDPAARRRRRTPESAAALDILAGGGPSAILDARLREAGAAGAGTADLARLLGVAPERAARLLASLGAKPTAAVRCVHREVWESLERAVLERLAADAARDPLAPGLAPDALLPPGADRGVCAALLEALAARGAIVRAGGRARLAGALAAADVHAATRGLAEAVRAGGLAPPDVAALVGSDPARRDALEHLLARGVLVRARDRVQKRAIVFHAEAIARARAALESAYGNGAPFLAREAGALWGVSRKFSIPLLEHLDAARVTRRDGERRVLAAAAGTAGRLTA